VTGTDGLQFQRAPDLEQVPHIITAQLAHHDAFVAHIAGQAILTKTMQGFTDGVTRSVIGRDQVVFHQRHARQQASTDDVGAQLQCDVVSQ
jgi:hypothetical protein